LYLTIFDGRRQRRQMSHDSLLSEKTNIKGSCLQRKIKSTYLIWHRTPRFAWPKNEKNEKFYSFTANGIFE